MCVTPAAWTRSPFSAGGRDMTRIEKAESRANSPQARCEIIEPLLVTPAPSARGRIQGFGDAHHMQAAVGGETKGVA